VSMRFRRRKMKTRMEAGRPKVKRARNDHAS
jgi:hypothetical protein